MAGAGQAAEEADFSRSPGFCVGFGALSQLRGSAALVIASDTTDSPVMTTPLTTRPLAKRCR